MKKYLALLCFIVAVQFSFVLGKHVLKKTIKNEGPLTRKGIEPFGPKGLKSKFVPVTKEIKKLVARAMNQYNTDEVANYTLIKIVSVQKKQRDKNNYAFGLRLLVADPKEPTGKYACEVQIVHDVKEGFTINFLNCEEPDSVEQEETATTKKEEFKNIRNVKSIDVAI